MRHHQREATVRRAGAAGVLGSAALLSAGCTLVGLGIGALIDKGHPGGPMVVEGWQLQTVRKGTVVHMTLRDGREVSGVFRGLGHAPEEYAPRYTDGRTRLLPDLPLPELEETVTVRTAGGQPRKGTFQGFNHSGLVLGRASGGKTDDVPFQTVSELVTAKGEAVTGSRLARLALEGELPLRARVMLEGQALPLEQVRQVEFHRPGTKGKLIGALVGAAIDVVIVAVAASSLSGPSFCETGCSNSCPYVYSFDGEGYVLEAETFGGAVFEAAQKADWVRLDHLQEQDGRYRLRLANELQEIQYVDEAKLLVVDEPGGGEIVPTRDGRLLTLRAPLAPTRAVDLRGRDVLDRVQSRDDEAWTSDPFGRDPDRREDVRDGLELEFPRPPGARAVTLAARVRSTAWASSLLRDLMSLQGRGLASWSAQMNADAAARAEFFLALRREGLPILRVWNGRGWQEAGFFANLGPAAGRDQAIRLDLADTPGDVLRVRLDSTAGMWIVDRVAADFGPDTVPRTTVLSPMVARSDGGEDLRRLLGTADGKRYRMDAGRSAAELVFEAPPLRPGCRRSFVLEVTGYYTILLPAEGRPQPVLFATLLREPGAFGRRSVRGLQDRVGAAVARLVLEAGDR